MRIFRVNTIFKYLSDLSKRSNENDFLSQNGLEGSAPPRTISGFSPRLRQPEKNMTGRHRLGGICNSYKYILSLHLFMPVSKFDQAHFTKS